MARIAALKKPNTISALDGYDPGNFYCELLGTEKQPSRPRPCPMAMPGANASAAAGARIRATLGVA